MSELFTTLASLEQQMLKQLPTLTKLYKDCPDELKDSVFNIIDKYLATASLIQVLVASNEKRV